MKLVVSYDNDNQPAPIARVIPWEAGEYYGVAIVLPNDKWTAYLVGSRTVADVECRSINDGKPPLFGPWAGLDIATPR
jgi:hypothetical protein